MLPITTLIKKLRKNMDWVALFNLVNSVEDLNSNQDRFLKSVYIETAFADFSAGLMVYINGHGQDWKVANNDTTVEGKFVKGGLFTKIGHNLKETVSPLELFNCRVGSMKKTLPKNYSPYIILIDSRGCAIVETAKVKKYIKFGGSGIQLKGCPVSLFTILYEVPRGTKFKKPKKSAKKIMEAGIKSYVAQFKTK